MLENDADVKAARDAGYDEALVARLGLKASKIRALAESVRRLAEMEEPIGQVLKRTEVISIFGPKVSVFTILLRQR
ncbi:hypothetical protein L1987_80766 [Smallanthus sonchifolius]|uniref:Uncharacterized protein n=1 Tax=Smallanthus sonchifolius TaxID=185202 RepID=A0ACB8YPT8_9ASTR|nr:hypothetical protein L1987_80766 [Smallanthus sonchifolius]